MVVLLERIELSTSSLPMTRSTTELQQPDHFMHLHRPLDSADNARPRA